MTLTNHMILIMLNNTIAIKIPMDGGLCRAILELQDFRGEATITSGRESGGFGGSQLKRCESSIQRAISSIPAMGSRAANATLTKLRVCQHKTFGQISKPFVHGTLKNLAIQPKNQNPF